MGKCKECRFWLGFDGPDGKRMPGDYMGMRECTEPGKGSVFMAPLWEGAATIGTAPDFGCVLFEPKADEPR